MQLIYAESMKNLEFTLSNRILSKKYISVIFTVYKVKIIQHPFLEMRM